MKRFTDAVRSALVQRNWYAALALAVTLPDMCVSIENGQKATWREYAGWFDAWVGRRYIVEFKYYNEDHANDPASFIQQAHEEGRLGGLVRKGMNYTKQEVFLSGVDCYCLRCSYSHEASGDISTQRIRESINKFIFVYKDGGISLHKNQSTGVDGVVKLQLDVEIFCLDLCKGVDDWLSDAEKQQKVLAVSSLLSIHPSSAGF